MTGVRMTGVRMTGVRMTGVRMTGVRMTGVRMTGVRLRGVHKTRFDGHSIACRSRSLRAITNFWISLVPSPMIINGESRKYRSTSYSWV